MNTTETRLRDAIASVAQAVSPDVVQRLELAISEPATYQRPAPARRQARTRRLVLTPIAAAAAFACVALLFALLTSPGAHRPQRQGAATMWALSIKGEPKFMVVQPLRPSAELQVRNAATGVVVAHVRIPAAPPNKEGFASAIATANGSTFLVAAYPPQQHACRSWLYQFTINGKGQPSAVTPFASLPTVHAAVINDLAISSDGHWLAFISEAYPPQCGGRTGSDARYINFTNIETGRTKRWSIPNHSGVSNVTLDANGGLLVYGYDVFRKGYPASSEVRLLPTSTPPGNAGTAGRAIVSSARFGPREDFAWAAITPDGRSAYLSVFREAPTGPEPGQIWGIDLASGHARFITGHTQFSNIIYADVHFRYLLMHIHNRFSRLTLATGKVVVMPHIWHHIFAIFIAW